MFEFDSYEWDKIFDSKDKVTNKEIIFKLKEVGNAARKCLASNDFSIYAEKYQEVEKGVINLLIKKAREFNGDISKFGAEVLSIIIRIDALRALLKDVDKDSKRWIKDSDGMGEENY